MKIYQYVTFWFLLIGILLIAVVICSHEQVHQEIFRSYGLDSRIDYFNYFPSVVTIGSGYCPTEECKLAHNINEAINYNSVGFYFLFYFGFAGIIFLLERIYYKIGRRTNEYS